MSLLQKIKTDQIQARKNRDKDLAAILTTLLAESSIPGLEDGKRDSTDDEVQAVVKKFLKNLNEKITAGGTWTATAMDIMEAECQVYESYLPKQLSEAELTELIDNIVSSCDSPNMGVIMRELKTSGANYDGKTASRIAQSALK